MKRSLFALVVLGVWFGSAVNGNVANASVEALKLVEDTTSLIMNRLSTSREKIRTNPERASELVSKIVLPHFDFTSMARKTLGKNWSKASKEQRRRFMEEYQRLLVRTYAKVLADNVNSKVDFLSTVSNHEQSEKVDVQIRTEVRPEAGFPIPIDYRLHLVDNAWKVYDVVIDGISIAYNYRSSFAQRIKREGMDRLIATLADQNKK